MKLLYSLFLILIFLTMSTFSVAADNGERTEAKKPFAYLLNEISTIKPVQQRGDGSYQTSAMILSAIIPGSGQAYLGHKLKGSLITIAFFTTAITAILSHNNMIGREDQIKSLTTEYLAARDYLKADALWGQIIAISDRRDEDYKRRNLFSIISAGVWALNMIDILFFTTDQRSGDFVRLERNSKNISLNFFNKKDFTGLSLSIYIP